MADFKKTLQDLNNTADTTSQYDANDIESNKIMAILAYFSWLVLIPLFAAKNSKFARFHCNQGIVIALIEIISWAAFGILSLIPLIGVIFAVAAWIVNVVCFIFSVIGIVNAVQGKAKELPFIGSIKIIK